MLHAKAKLQLWPLLGISINMSTICVYRRQFELLSIFQQWPKETKKSIKVTAAAKPDHID